MLRYNKIKLFGSLIVLLILVAPSWYLFNNYDYFQDKVRTKKVLELAGENQIELKKVLDYFSNDPLKFKAAKYLILNMPGHYFYQNNFSRQYNLMLTEGASTYGQTLDLRNKKIRSRWDTIKVDIGAINYSILPKVEDVKVMSSDYLIYHINHAFDTWNSPWCAHMDFDDFCRFLLPYRVENEPLEDWRKIITEQKPWLTELKNSGYTVYQACCIVNDSIKSWISGCSAFDFIPRQPVSDLFFSRVGNCIDMTSFTVFIMRTAGIPVASVKCPGGHNWHVLFDEDGIKDFMGGEFNPVKEFGGMYYHRMGIHMIKSYLKTYHIEKANTVLYAKQKTEDIPPFFRNPYFEDISEKVLFRQSITIPMFPNKNENDRSVIYLNQIGANKYEGIPISWIENTKNSSVTFDGISPTGTYFLSRYNNGRYKHESKPVSILSDGSTHIWTPNWNKLVSCNITRKFGMSFKMKEFSQKLIGAVIQGANSPDFFDADELGTLNRTIEFLDGDTIKSTKEYRYLRLLPLDTSSIHIAELKFFGSEGKVIKGSLISPNKNESSPYAFDDDITTNFNGQKGEWIGLDLGMKRSIKSFKILPRNNFNVIEPGDDYELFVFDDKIISLGLKTAVTNSLYYNNIPEGAILFLVNRTKGIEFQHFVPYDGGQLWINGLLIDELTDYIGGLSVR